MREASKAEPAEDAAILRSAARFLRDFAGFAGWPGLRAAVAVAVAAGLENVGVVLLIPFLSLAMDEKAPGGAAAALAAPVFALLNVETRLGKLGAMLALFAALLTLRALANGVQIRILTKLRMDYVESRRARLLDALAAASWSRVLALRHARVQRAINDDAAILGAVVRFPLDAGVAILTLIAQIAAAAALAPVFATLCLSLLAATALVARPLLRHSYELGAALTADRVALDHSLGQFLGALKLAISQNLQRSFVGEFEAALADLKRRQIAFLLQQSDSQHMLSLLSGVVAMLCAFIGLGLMDMPAPLVFGLLLILARVGAPAQTLVRSAQQFVHGLPAWERACRLEAELSDGAGNGAPPRSVQERETPPPADALDGAIVFSAVCYRHGDGETAPGVHGVDLTISPGEIIGVTGPSGAGKTTFADLLVGLIRPQSGVISISGRKLDGALLDAWRHSLAYVAQDAFLFHDTLRRNLLWAAPEAGEDAIWRALSLVGADALAKRLPNGLDTIVGERGALLSGGERQRFALARAILRTPRLLVLDEATSALDLDSEHVLLSRLAELDPAPTMVIIAHRPESLRLGGRLLTFADGRLIGETEGPCAGSGARPFG
ncbi:MULTISPECIES: ATP-binding cassette domain-containing protein [Methylosinus]|nr:MULTISPECIES: ABC transporter ATP-binding protein [Methylosinus]